MFTINNVTIGRNSKPYLIAEISANHNGSLERAKLIIKAAKSSGADAVKMQTYTADTMTLNINKPEFMIHDGLWKGYSLYDLYKEASTPYEWHGALFKYAAELGITIFSTPFDETAVDLLETLNTPAYKVASFELIDTPLIQYIASKKKPMLMSTGMANEEEVGLAVETARTAGCSDILLFHCISSYPAMVETSNLLNIQYLKNHFQVEVGLSDHTMGNTASVAAVALGAVAIEKHFTLSRQDKGPDSAFSLEPAELSMLVHDTKMVWSALGQPGFHRADSEQSNLKFRRSIYFAQDLKAGDIITKDSLCRIRPGYGLSPKYFEQLLGKTLAHDVQRGDPVSLESIIDHDIISTGSKT